MSKHPYPPSPGGTSVAQVERAQLCDLLEQVGPHAPTLSGAWDTHQLAAHLVARERNLLALVHLLGPGSGDGMVERMVAARDLPSLVEDLRVGPPRLSLFGTDFVDRRVNGLEFFIHHEDVRRAQPGFEQRVLPLWALDELWKGLGMSLRGLTRKAPIGLTLKRSDSGETRTTSKKPQVVVVVGLPTELALFAYGRGAVADVSYDGSPEDVTALESAALGF